MAPLGPFEPRPALAVAVSGGADSMCLAWLAAAWAREQGGTVQGLVVDHGLRPDSAAEARLTAGRLDALGIVPRVLTLSDLGHGPRLAERARAARHAALERECAGSGILHLLFGHHAADQAETVAMRMLRGATSGLAGMAPLVESAQLRRLRPLLAIPPGRLRATLLAAGRAWVDDPSNADPRAERNRLRLLRADRDGSGPATRAAVEAAFWRAAARAASEAGDAAWLARHAEFRPEGYALLDPHGIPPGALAALLRMLAGRDHPPAAAGLAAWAAAPRPATLGGVRFMAAPGARLYCLREAAAMAPPVRCRAGAVWDGRFRMLAAPSGQAIDDITFGALGAEAAGLRRLSPLPAAVLNTLPALRRAGRLFAVPHLGYDVALDSRGARIVFAPPGPAAGAGFFVMPGKSMPGMQRPPGHPM